MAAAFVDGMPQSCSTTDDGSGYAVRHDPWAYFTNELTSVRGMTSLSTGLPGVIAQGSLPTVRMVIPNLCNDAHNCPLNTADAWFKGWMTQIFDGSDWRSGHLAVVLTADEDDRSSDNTVLTVVIHPNQKANVVTAPLTHYSLTRLFEEVAG